MQKIWYEVFISGKKGTRTLQICETPKEAREVLKTYKVVQKRDNWKGTLHIDKWKNMDNPVCIGEVIFNEI